jgi:D-alanyl-D-alanine carboxypeptidase
MEDLLNGLLIYSGNDAAVAIAEHVAGSMDAFAQMMNDEASRLMATNSHFVNSNGLQNEDHYTTVYDLYLIFNECIKYDEFVQIIQSDSYTASIKKADGSTKAVSWNSTNYYKTGKAELPTGATVLGGKTGTTDEAGSCLILLDVDAENHPYISITMGATSKDILYQDMTTIIDQISN